MEKKNTNHAGLYLLCLLLVWQQDICGADIYLVRLSSTYQFDKGKQQSYHLK